LFDRDFLEQGRGYQGAVFGYSGGGLDTIAAIDRVVVLRTRGSVLASLSHCAADVLSGTPIVNNIAGGLSFSDPV